jgi:hypothetical protein
MAARARPAARIAAGRTGAAARFTAAPTVVCAFSTFATFAEYPFSTFAFATFASFAALAFSFSFALALATVVAHVEPPVTISSWHTLTVQRVFGFLGFVLGFEGHEAVSCASRWDFHQARLETALIKHI